VNSNGIVLGNSTRFSATTLRNLSKYLVKVAIAFLAYVVAGKLGQATANIRSSNLGPVWPAYGIAVAAILIGGYRMWVGVAAGAFLVAFFSPVPHITALGQAAGATLAAMTAAFLLHRVAHFRSSLSRLSDALGLIALGAAGSAIVSASIGVLVLHATHVDAYSGLGAAWLIYWLGDATGVLLVTPLVLTFPEFLELRGQNRISELALLLLALTGVCMVIFGDWQLIPVRLHVLAFAVLPFVMWAAIRFGVSAATLSILIVATIATIETALGSGPFARNTPFTNGVLLDVYFTVLSASGLTLAAMIAEREHAEGEREQAIREQAAMEAQRKTEAVVRESEERLRLAAEAGKMYADELDTKTEVVMRSPEYVNVLGSAEPMSLTLQQLLNRVYPEDRAKLLAAIESLTPENPMTHVTYRVQLRSGVVVWLEKIGRGFFDQQGRMRRMISMVADVTERKRAEEALSDVNRKLIEAHEEERTWIARELHDDINQRIALLAIELEQLGHHVPGLGTESDDYIRQARQKVLNIGKDIQALSHRLHSSKLDYLGFAAAASSYCKELSEQQKVEIDFSHAGIPRHVPKEISLCLFRVLQEALQNAVKHSGVRHFKVEVHGTSEDIRLSVIDSGSGFDPAVAAAGQGLGLTSMKERVHLINGDLSVETQPYRGSTIRVRAPLKSEESFEEAAG
jgi:PAS domain S-box-containing protein